MPENKLKKFCQLTRYIKQIDKDLFQVLEDLCIMHYFKPGRDVNGITFLYPKEKSYRQKIINAAYSTSPEVAVNMIKSLIVQGYYPDESAMNNELVNLLGQKIEIEGSDSKGVKLVGGLMLVKDSAFVPMSHRENMSVFVLSGKGEIPLNGPSGSVRSPKTGGGMCYPNNRKSELHKLLVKKYCQELSLANTDANSHSNVVNNIYTKKVFLQLKMIQNSSVHLPELFKYLGNDEFSDSYLLDIYCEKYCSQHFDNLYKCLGNGNCDHLDLGLSAKTRTDYLNRKAEIINEIASKYNISTKMEEYSTDKLFKGVLSPMDVRTRVGTFYSEKEILGKDLFIVFSNLTKESWMLQSNSDEACEIFQNYAYLASSVYNDLKSLANQEFDPAYDLTLYGNLLMSDVLQYKPTVLLDDSLIPSGYSILQKSPVPTELQRYSLNHLAHNLSRKVTGGAYDSSISAMLGGLL